MISYQPNRLYLVRNTETKAGQYFQCMEAFGYNGHTVVYGGMLGYGIRLARGPLEFPGKPVSFSQPNLTRYGAKGWAALELLLSNAGGQEQAHGLYGRLRVSELEVGKDPQVMAVKHAEGPEEPLYAPGRIEAEMFGGQNYTDNGGWQGRTPNRDGLVYCSRKMLDLFDDTVRLGNKIPAWFSHMRLQHYAAIERRVSA